MLRKSGLFVAAMLFAAPVLADETPGPSQIVLHQHGHGWLLTDDKGVTVYTYDKDVEPGKSACNAACAKQWPPILATTEADRAKGDWSLIEREDAAKQWAYRGKPLYKYSRDGAPGDANGDGLAGQWHHAFRPIPMPPGIGIEHTLIGVVLTDQKNLTLYRFDKDKADGSGCDAACAHTWMPMLAPTVAHGFGDWTVNTRKDGTRQWAFKGTPVYRYNGDVHVAETSGETAAKGWHAVVLEPAPSNPSWMTVQQSDAGQVVADGNGRTLYAFDPTARPLPGGGVIVPQFDNPEDWAPLPAADGDKSVGYWSVVDSEGKKQWAYKGMPLYINKRDKVPGDLFGSQGGGRARLRPIMRAALA